MPDFQREVISMKTRTKLLICTAALICTIAGLALATPGAGFLFNNILSLGSIERDVNEHVRVDLDAAADAAAGREAPGNRDRDDDWSARISTQGPSNFIVQDVALIPGGFTGWHSHPGVLLITVTEGSIEFYDQDCAKRTYIAGQSFTEGADAHAAVNRGTS